MNKSSSVHYLQGLEGCGTETENSIQTQFFKILARIKSELNKQNYDIDYTHKQRVLQTDRIVHLINALCCWDFKLNDHERLAKLNLPQTLYQPNGDPLHPLASAWGREARYETIQIDREKEFKLSMRLS